MYRATAEWNKELDPVRFIERGEEPSSIGLTGNRPQQNPQGGIQ
jgi:hypothetical protein